MIAAYQHSEIISVGAFSCIAHNSQKIAVGSPYGILLYQTETLEKNGIIKTKSPVIRVAFGPKGVLAVVEKINSSTRKEIHNTRVSLFDLDAQEAFFSVSIYCSFGHQIEFVPNGLWLIGYSSWHIPLDGTPPTRIVIPQSKSPKPGVVTQKKDGSLIAAEEWKTEIALYDPASKQAPKRLKGHQGNIIALRFSPDEKLLAVIDYQQLSVWSLKNKKRIYQSSFPKGRGASMKRVAFSPDGKTVIALRNQELHIWSIRWDKLKKKGKYQLGPVLDIIFLNDRELIYVQVDRLVQIDLKGRKKHDIKNLYLKSGPWFSSEEHISMRTIKDELITLSLPEQTPREPIPIEPASISGELIFNGIYEYGTYGDEYEVNTSLALYQNKQEFARFDHDSEIQAFRFLCEQKVVLYTAGSLFLWNFSTNEKKKISLRHSITQLSAQSNTIIAILSNRDHPFILKIWDDSGLELAEFELDENRIGSMDLSGDGKILMLGKENGIVDLWDFERAKRGKKDFSRLWNFNRAIRKVVFSPCGGRLAVSTFDGILRTWQKI